MCAGAIVHCRPDKVVSLAALIPKEERQVGGLIY